MLAQTSHSNNSPVNDNKIDFIISHHGSCSRISLIKTRVISMLAPFAAYICQVNNASLSNTLEQTYSVYLPFEGSRHLFDHAPHSLLSRQLIASWIFLPFRILWNCRVPRLGEKLSTTLKKNVINNAIITLPPIPLNENLSSFSFPFFLSPSSKWKFHRLFNESIFSPRGTGCQVRSRWRRIRMRRLKFGTRKGAAK